jgi:PLP dependent protein
VHDELQSRLNGILTRIASACAYVDRDPRSVTLIAVSKTVDCPVVAAMMALGHTRFGENRPQELWRKAEAIPNAEWHFIGHLQRNKIERTVPLATLIHSVDSERLLMALNDYGIKHRAMVPVLLEVNCSHEEAKGGFESNQLLSQRWTSLKGVSIQGLMTMAAYFDDPKLCRPAFRELRSCRDQLRTLTGWELPHLSMGMSNDFEIAIEEGATHIRIGSSLFQT